MSLERPFRVETLGASSTDVVLYAEMGVNMVFRKSESARAWLERTIEFGADLAPRTGEVAESQAGYLLFLHNVVTSVAINSFVGDPRTSPQLRVFTAYHWVLLAIYLAVLGDGGIQSPRTSPWIFGGAGVVDRFQVHEIPTKINRRERYLLERDRGRIN